MANGQRDILHLDMDAFYASVEVLDNPELRGQPVIVGGTSNRGVVSAASYEAREFGVHSALPIVTARRRCPHGVFLPVRMWRYVEMSEIIFSIFRRFTPLVEPLSLDEAFLDVTGSRRLFGTPVEIAAEIKRLVKSQTGLTVSAGSAPTKFVAKIASDLQKPDGLTVVEPGKVCEFLHPLPIGRLWGVGRATQKALALLGVETIGDLARIPEEVLTRRFGEHGRHLSLLSRGIDDRDVHPDHEIKSLGAEDTYPEDVTRVDAAKKELLWLATRVSRRLRRKGFTARTITLKVKYSDFKQVTRAVTLGRATDEAREIYQAACGLLPETAVGKRPVRLLGISLSKLGLWAEDSAQPSLFPDNPGNERGRRLDRAMDAISDKYGAKAILPATLVDKDR